jgi:hypothetical protein
MTSEKPAAMKGNALPGRVETRLANCHDRGALSKANLRHQSRLHIGVAGAGQAGRGVIRKYPPPKPAAQGKTKPWLKPNRSVR